MEVGGDLRRSEVDVEGGGNGGQGGCLLCEKELVNSKGNPSKTPTSLKSLFQFLHIDVSRICLEERSRRTTEVMIAASICEECASLAVTFGSIYEDFDKALTYMKQVLQILHSRCKSSNKSNNNNSNNHHLSSTGATPPPTPPEEETTNGSKMITLKAEVLKKCELRLKLKPEDEQLPTDEEEGEEEKQLENNVSKDQQRSAEDDDDADDAMIVQENILEYYDRLGEEGQQFFEQNNLVEEESSAPLHLNNSNGLEEHIQIQNGSFGERSTSSSSTMSITRTIRTESTGEPPGWRPLLLSTDDTTTTTPIMQSQSRKCEFCGISFRGPKSQEKKHLLCAHTVNYFPSELIGFSQKDVDRVAGDICRQELLTTTTNNSINNNGVIIGTSTFQCSFCQASGLRDTDKKLHLIEAHLDEVKSRLEAWAAAKVSNSNYLVDSNNGPTINGGDFAVGGIKLEPSSEMEEMDMELPPFGYEQVEAVYHDQVNNDDDGNDEDDDDDDDEEQEEDQLGNLEQDQLLLEDLQEESDDDESDDNVGGNSDSPGTDSSNPDRMEEDDDETPTPPPPRLEVMTHSCGYCDLPLRGPLSNLKRHMMCCHTAAYFAKQRTFQGFTDEEIDAVIWDICQQGQLPDTEKHDTFLCSYCGQVGIGDKKFHLLDQHVAVVVSRLEKAPDEVVPPVSPNLSESPPPEPPPPVTLPQPHLMSIKREVIAQLLNQIDDPTQPMETSPSPPTPPEVEEVALPPDNTEQMRQRLNVKSNFDQNRSYFKSNEAKPPFTYAFLIRQAIKESPAKKLDTDDLTCWFQANFRFYQKRGKVSLKRNIADALNKKRKCFVRLEEVVVDGRGGTTTFWGVKDREFYKSGTKWARTGTATSKRNKKIPTTTSTTSANHPVRHSVIVKTENLQEDIYNFTEEDDSTSSSRNNGDEAVLAPIQGNHNHHPLANIQNKRHGANNRGGGGGPKSAQVVQRRTSKTSYKCSYCGIICYGPKANLERHLMCVHTTLHFSSQLRSPQETDQEELNRAVKLICGQSLISAPSGRSGGFHCDLCGCSRTGEKKYHVFKEHFSAVLAALRVEKEVGGGGGGGRGSGDRARSFEDDYSLAPSELLLHLGLTERSHQWTSTTNNQSWQQ